MARARHEITRHMWVVLFVEFPTVRSFRRRIVRTPFAFCLLAAWMLCFCDEKRPRVIILKLFIGRHRYILPVCWISSSAIDNSCTPAWSFSGQRNDWIFQHLRRWTLMQPVWLVCLRAKILDCLWTIYFCFRVWSFWKKIKNKKKIVQLEYADQ